MERQRGGGRKKRERREGDCDWDGVNGLKVREGGKEGRREKMSCRNSKGAFCPFLHHSVLLVLLFRLSKHRWSLIKPEHGNLHARRHTHTQTHTQRKAWDGWKEEGCCGGNVHISTGAFKNDLHTPQPYSAQSPETLMETIWEFWVIWQAAYLVPDPPFSTHFGGEWANRTQKALSGRECVLPGTRRLASTQNHVKTSACWLAGHRGGRCNTAYWHMKNEAVFRRGSDPSPEARERSPCFTAVNIRREDWTSKLRAEKTN